MCACVCVWVRVCVCVGGGEGPERIWNKCDKGRVKRARGICRQQ